MITIQTVNRSKESSIEVKGFYKDYTLLNNNLITHGDFIFESDTCEVMGNEEIFPLGNNWAYKLNNKYSIGSILKIKR